MKQLDPTNPGTDPAYKAAVERLQALTSRRAELERELADLFAQPAPSVEALLAGDAPTAKRERAAELREAIESLQGAERNAAADVRVAAIRAVERARSANRETVKELVGEIDFHLNELREALERYHTILHATRFYDAGGGAHSTIDEIPFGFLHEPLERIRRADFERWTAALKRFGLVEE